MCLWDLIGFWCHSAYENKELYVGNGGTMWCNKMLFLYHSIYWYFKRWLSFSSIAGLISYCFPSSVGVKTILDIWKAGACDYLWLLTIFTGAFLVLSWHLKRNDADVERQMKFHQRQRKLCDCKAFTITSKWSAKYGTNHHQSDSLQKTPDHSSVHLAAWIHPGFRSDWPAGMFIMAF